VTMSRSLMSFGACTVRGCYLRHARVMWNLVEIGGHLHDSTTHHCTDQHRPNNHTDRYPFDSEYPKPCGGTVTCTATKTIVSAGKVLDFSTYGSRNLTTDTCPQCLFSHGRAAQAETINESIPRKVLSNISNISIVTFEAVHLACCSPIPERRVG
jgi:hypothetical protein